MLGKMLDILGLLSLRMRQAQFHIKYFPYHHQLVNHISRIFQVPKGNNLLVCTRAKDSTLHLPQGLRLPARAKQLLSSFTNNPSKDMETTHHRLQDLKTRTPTNLKVQPSRNTGNPSKDTASSSLMYLSRISHHLQGRIAASMLLPTPMMVLPYGTIIPQSDALIITTASNSKLELKAWER